MELAKARGAAKRGPRIGGHVLADALVAQGITHAFAVPGESYLDVLDGLYAVRDRVQLVTCRFEAGAVDMAEACGKLTGRPAAAFVTRGPGACHGAIGVHVAQQDSTPLLLFVGQIPFSETDRDSFQEVDYRRMFGPLAKWVTQIDDAARIPELVAHAVDVATSGRPGPVVIAISEEMQKQVVEVPDIGPAPVSVAYPDPAALARLQTMLAAARRPLAILGGGWTQKGRAAIRDFLTAQDIPTAVGFRRQSLYDGTLDTFVGDLGVGSDPALVAKAREADLVLAFGTRLGEAVTQGYTLFDLAGATPIVHVHPDAGEIGRVFRPALGIVADLEAFAVELCKQPPVAVQWAEWRRELRALRLAGLEVPDYAGPLNLAACMRALEEELEPDAIMTCDAGNFATWSPRFMHVRDRQAFIGPTNGAMGYGVPAAIGAKIMFPKRQVVAFVGDGGCLMTGQEIATAFHHGVAPILLVFNNNMYGTIRMYQERAYPARVSGTALTNPDFCKFIEAFGGHGETVTATEDFVPAFRRAVASGKPALIELRTNPEQISSRATITQLRAAAGVPAAKQKPARVPAPVHPQPGNRAAPKKPGKR
jgi:acetolactate synthase-1/2/3 large subunit